jgi:site-specific DNA-cytosine methylase
MIKGKKNYDLDVQQGINELALFAGIGGGIEGKQSGLWSEMARIIGEVRPRYVFVENVSALTSRGLGVVIGN